MALPERVSRGQMADPQDLARNDFNTMLSRLFTRGLFADVDDAGTLSAPLNYGVDIREDDDHIYVEADLPGFRKEDIDISLENGMLTIVAEHKEDIEVPADQAGGQQGQQAQGQQAQGQQGQQAAGQQGQQGGQQGRQQRAGRQRQDYLLRERVIRRFVRSFSLPPNVDESNVQATLENGVLKLVLNKREESKPKKIRVS